MAWASYGAPYVLAYMVFQGSPLTEVTYLYIYSLPLCLLHFRCWMHTNDIFRSGKTVKIGSLEQFHINIHLLHQH